MGYCDVDLLRPLEFLCSRLWRDCLRRMRTCWRSIGCMGRARRKIGIIRGWTQSFRPTIAAMVLKEMTLDEKIALVHGMGMPGWPRDVQDPQPELGNGGAGFVLGVPRLGIPIIQMSDAAYGVRSSGENGRYSTALPANIAAAASWDTAAACAYGALIGKELRAQGYNMTLGGGTNITREPRNGRTFEYLAKIRFSRARSSAT